MTSQKWILGVAVAVFVMSASPSDSRAESDLSENTKEAVSDIKKGTKKTARSIKDKSCELVDGKMNCAAKKMKHKAENAADEVKDAVN